MLTDAEVAVEESEAGENYFVSMTDMMVGMLFLFIIMLMVFALNYRVSDDDSKRIKECLQALLVRNAQLSSEITSNVNRIQQDVGRQIQTLELAADQRRLLLNDIRDQLSRQNITVEVDERNGVLRLTEAAVRFDPGKSELDSVARTNVRRTASVLSSVVAKYAACTASDIQACQRFRGPALETIFVEGHTDRTGVPDPALRDRINWQLSTERATATYRELIAYAPTLPIYRNRRQEQLISVSGYSSTRAISPGDDAVAWQKNRRIDLRFVMDADRALTLADIIALNEEVKAQIARLAAISQESVEACK